MELDVNSDETIGSVQNGIHRALFWHERGMSKVSFSKLPKNRTSRQLMQSWTEMIEMMEKK